GFYRDWEEPAPKHGYSYCWPLCGLLQAFNEADDQPSFQRITVLLDQYKSNKHPMPDPGGPAVPGYDSYIVQFGGGDRFYDDNQWLGLAWMDAWFRRRGPAPLERGQHLYPLVMDGHENAPC